MEKLIVPASDYIIGDSRKGKQWAKLISSVDSEGETGYAFNGKFLRKEGEESLPINGLILSVGYEGSWKNGELYARIFRVLNDGNLEEMEHIKYSNFFSLRDKLVELCDNAKESETDIISAVETDLQKIEDLIKTRKAIFGDVTEESTRVLNLLMMLKERYMEQIQSLKKEG